MKEKLAMVTGISGQDGAYLSALLVSRGYRVVGVTRQAGKALARNLSYLGIADVVDIVPADIGNYNACRELIRRYEPNEVYNLAAQSSVSESFGRPLDTIHFNVISVLNLLEAIRNAKLDVRFYQASSSEMYGRLDRLPVQVESVLHPVSPYGISKATGHWLVRQSRESYGVFAVSGVLFNHESVLRPETFFVKKVVAGALRIARGDQHDLRVGNLDLRRDFGSAKDYVHAIWLMLQADSPRDYMVCSGRSLSLRDIIEHVFHRLNLDPKLIIEDPALHRPSEIVDIYGDPSPIRADLGWEGEADFFSVLDGLIEEEAQFSRFK